MEKIGVNFKSGEGIADLKEELLQKAKDPRGRKAGGKNKLSKVPVVDSETLDKLFSPEQFETLVSLPAHTAFALTGDEVWLLDEKETKILGVSASSTAKYFLRTDPKWVALSMFGINIAVIYGARAIAYFKNKKTSKKPEIIKDETAK